MGNPEPGQQGAKRKSRAKAKKDVSLVPPSVPPPVLPKTSQVPPVPPRVSQLSTNTNIVPTKAAAVPRASSSSSTFTRTAGIV